MKIEWDYTLNISKIVKQFESEEISNEGFIDLLVKEVLELIKIITDDDLKEDLEEWINNNGYFDEKENKYFPNSDDTDEIEEYLSALYNIADYDKSIWIETNEVKE